jgi:hypothetical protein
MFTQQSFLAEHYGLPVDISTVTSLAFGLRHDCSRLCLLRALWRIDHSAHCRHSDPVVQISLRSDGIRCDFFRARYL